MTRKDCFNCKYRYGNIDVHPCGTCEFKNGAMPSKWEAGANYISKKGNPNMIQKYRKKPVVVEAIQWTGSNTREVTDFIGKDNFFGFPYGVIGTRPCKLLIKTLEGPYRALIGDYIIKSVQGEFYPCKPDIFERTYELVE